MRGDRVDEQRDGILLSAKNLTANEAAPDSGDKTQKPKGRTSDSKLTSMGKPCKHSVESLHSKYSVESTCDEATPNENTSDASAYSPLSDSLARRDLELGGPKVRPSDCSRCDAETKSPRDPERPTATSGARCKSSGGPAGDGPADHETGEQAADKGRPKPEPPFMFAGIAASILCSVFFSCSLLSLKLLPDSNTMQEKTMACLSRGIIIMTLCGLTSYLQGSSLRVERDEIWINVLRAVFGFFGVLASYFSLSYISMGDSTALVFSSPVWTSLLSHFILKEPIEWVQILALPASLFGIILIAHPALVVPLEHLPGKLSGEDRLPPLPDARNFTSELLDANGNRPVYLDAASSLPATTPSTLDFEHRWPGIVIALGASLMVSCVYIVLKFRRSTPIQTTTFWLGFVTSLASLAIMGGIGFGHLPNSWSELGLLFSNGFFSWLGQSALQWAFFYENASVLSVVRTLDVAMSFALSAIFLQDEIYWTSIVGSMIISLVVVTIMLNNWIRSIACRPASSSPPVSPHRTGSETSWSTTSLSDCADPKLSNSIIHLSQAKSGLSTAGTGSSAHEHHAEC